LSFDISDFDKMARNPTDGGFCNYVHPLPNITCNTNVLLSGLPDGLFYDQKSQFGYILDGLGMENVGRFYGRSV
jgi:hypothetical protein